MYCAFQNQYAERNSRPNVYFVTDRVLSTLCFFPRIGFESSLLKRDPLCYALYLRFAAVANDNVVTSPLLLVAVKWITHATGLKLLLFPGKCSYILVISAQELIYNRQDMYTKQSQNLD